MVQITERERKEIQAAFPNAKFTITSRRKNAGGSTYYIWCDSYKLLDMVSEMRNVEVEKLLVG